MLKTFIQVNPVFGNVPFDSAWGTGHSCFKSLPNDISELSKLKVLADDKRNANQKYKFGFNKEDKRAMMALNRSPESVSPQNEFYLLYNYCSNL